MSRTRQPDTSIDERAQLLLKRLVEHYLVEGTPAASKLLAAQPGIEVSPATVRNIMVALESMGFVRSPHTSAGKIPTSLGLRFFVDSLVSYRPIGHEQIERLEAELTRDLSEQQLVESASNMLSHITQMACVVTLPKRDNATLRHIEFLPLSGSRVLVILVLNDREVQNRVLTTDREYSEAELVQAGNYLNQEFSGASLQDIRRRIIDSMHDDKRRMDSLMQTALDMASQTFTQDEPSEPEMVVSGESNLLEMSGDREALRSLFESFSQKGEILHLLDECLNSNGIQLFIGEESGFRALDEVSLVTASYEIRGEVAGVLGVVGPTRMAYQEVIPVVDVTARMLGSALAHS